MKHSKQLKFLIIDGYAEPSRLKFDKFGMRRAGILYKDMIHQHLPDAECTIMYSSDPGVETPNEQELLKYDALAWPGCNLTVYHTHDPRVTKMVDLSNLAYETGVPQFGSCWGIQLACYVAGGKVEPNPKGREMGVGRMIRLTEAGKNHPMFKGKPLVFSGFVSHDDHITELPKGATLLASNFHSPVQAVEVRYKKGVFWATQYHTEYDLHEVAKLILAREEKLIKQGFFKGHDDLVEYSEKMDSLFYNPDTKYLRWQLGIDDDLIKDEIRQSSFTNWLSYIVIPLSEKRELS